jgi:intracellular sulfur oxidation DsrE/DsrF family protein
MRTVFHVSNPDALAIAPAKIENLLADSTVTLDGVRVVIDDGRTVARLGDDSDTVPALQSLPDRVDVGVCSNALSGAPLDEAALPSFVETLSSGVGELTRLQSNGFSYIRLLG